METKRNFDAAKHVQEGYNLVIRAIDAKKSLQTISEMIRGLVNSYQSLNRNERYELYSDLYDLARACKSQVGENWKTLVARRNTFVRIDITARRVFAEMKLRQRRSEAREAVRAGFIFFICSEHNDPADGHADLQGKVYVDRYWRQKVSGQKYNAVAAYIKNHNCMTLQEAMKGPFWLTTRMYCKHFFIPLEIDTVLHNSQGKLRRAARKVYTYHEHTYQDVIDLRRRVFEKADKYVPCEQFKKIKKRSI